MLIDNEIDELEGIQKNILIDLYNSCDGSTWYKKDNWLLNKPLNEWYGIQIDEDRTIISLDLSENNLSGRIPDNLYMLFNLEALNLNDNYLLGNISDNICNLEELREINLSHNTLTGTIPDCMPSLVNLQLLDLNTNELIGPIPESLGWCSEFDLEYLDLRYNEFNGQFPDNIEPFNPISLDWW